MDGTLLVPGSEGPSGDNLIFSVDSFLGSISESDSDMSASWSPPSEDLPVIPPSSDLTTDSSNNTQVSSSSRSRLESAFHAITLVWGWGTTVDTVSCDCTDSGLESDLGARSFLSRFLVQDRVIGFGWAQTWVCWVLELELISQVREDSCAQSSPWHAHQGDEHWTQESRHWFVKWPHKPLPSTCLPTCSSLATQSVAALDLQAAEQHLAPSSHTTSCWPLLFPSTGLAPPNEHALNAPGALLCSH